MKLSFVSHEVLPGVFHMEDPLGGVHMTLVVGSRKALLMDAGYGALDVLAQVRTLTGLRRKDDGRFIDPSDLDRLEREQLANVFDVQRMVQNAVRRHFNLEAQR